MVHEDDYATSGYKEDLAWLQGQLESAYEITTQHIGPCSCGFSEGNVLKRVVRWNDGGRHVEADPPHAELIIEQLSLGSLKRLSTPGIVEYDKPEAADEEALGGNDVTLVRGLAARCNYLSLGRADLQYSDEEVCCEMSKPARGSLRRLVGLGRYLISRPRLVWHVRYQTWPSRLANIVYANWAGCRRTRKSTSGGRRGGDST